MSHGVVLAGSGSSAGKTTLTCGLMRSLTNRGFTVAPFKVGPDFLDPTHHAQATGRQSRNLDPFLSSETGVREVFRRGVQDANFAVIEGVAGLFDGERLDSDYASTAHVARILQLPVVLIVDAEQSGRTLAAIASGLVHFDASIEVSGIILNKVWRTPIDPRLADLLAHVAAPILGAIPRIADTPLSDRHLGLLPATIDADSSESMVQQATEFVEKFIDIDSLIGSAGVIPDVQDAQPANITIGGNTIPAHASAVDASHTVAVATGAAFSFCYPENIEAFNTLALRVEYFDPRWDTLPEADAFYFPGGYPEFFSPDLAANAALISDLAEASADGARIYAECGGYLYLCEQVGDDRGAGLLPLIAQPGQLQLSYVTVQSPRTSTLLPTDYRTRGHVYHLWNVHPNSGRDLPALWQAAGEFFNGDDGVSIGTIAAGFTHTQWVTDWTIPARILGVLPNHDGIG